MLLKCALGCAIAALTVTVANADVSLQDRQQAACYNDVQRLCGAFIPDATKVEACMSTKKDKVSAGCRKYFAD